MELNWFIIYLFLWFYLRINSLWTALTALRYYPIIHFHLSLQRVVNLVWGHV
jgi:hypothetical protein